MLKKGAQTLENKGGGKAELTRASPAPPAAFSAWKSDGFTGKFPRNWDQCDSTVPAPPAQAGVGSTAWLWAAPGPGQGTTQSTHGVLDAVIPLLEPFSIHNCVLTRTLYSSENIIDMNPCRNISNNHFSPPLTLLDSSKSIR